jgi:Ser/Thr protein kinase RdoA (MazF antagonist)
MSFPNDPTQQTAISIVQSVLGKKVIEITRFPTGLDNYVYKVQLEDGKNIVARLNNIGKESQYIAAIYWYQKLKTTNVPLPALLASSATPGDIPYMLLDYVSGKDLGDVYFDLSVDQKKHIAKHIASIQQSVATNLPLGPGYGFADSYQAENLHSDWHSVLHAHLDRSREWINEIGLVDPQHVETIRQKLPKYKEYFSKIKPIPFLHDTTTKNVLVANGRVVGIVDVDSICFGDSLFVPALTKMALLSMDAPIDYIDYWLQEINISKEQSEIVDLYTAMFCVNFMGEVGKAFNKDISEVSNTKKNLETKNKYEKILESLIKEI